MAELIPLVLATVLLLLAAAIAGKYVGGTFGVLRRGWIYRALRGVTRLVSRLLMFFVRLLLPRRPRNVRTLPAARTFRRTRSTRPYERF